MRQDFCSKCHTRNGGISRKPSLLKNSRLSLRITVQDTDVDTEVVDEVCADDISCQQVAVTCEPAATAENELTGLDNHVSEVPVVPETKRISLIEIRLYPNCSNVQCTSGRQGRRAEAAAVLTASPYKDKLVEKCVKAKTKKGRETKCSKELPQKSRKATCTSKQSTGKKKPPEEGQTLCIYCCEAYCDPPDEDWIACSVCSNWSHESCSPAEPSEDFVCDYCL